MIQLCARICSSIFCRIFYLVLVILQWLYSLRRSVCHLFLWIGVIIILDQSFGGFSVTIILLNRFVNVLVIISPPAFINSEVITSTPGNFMLASCFIEYLTSCSVSGGMFSLLISTESNSCREFSSCLNCLFRCFSKCVFQICNTSYFFVFRLPR